MNRYLSVFILSVIALIFVTGTFAQTSHKQLFKITKSERAVSDRSSIASVREAEITFNTNDLIVDIAANFEIPLFDGKVYLAERSGVEFRALDDITWRGAINDKAARHDVILTMRKGYVSGLIYSPEGVFEIIPRGEKHILVELDQQLFPECGGEIEPALETKENAAPAVLDPTATIDSGDRLDILVVYTPAVKNFLGGDAQAQAFSQQAIDATNTTYINSNVRQRVRMVHSAEYVFTETGNSSADLSSLRSNATVQALRDTHKADLVAMIAEVGDVCGIAYLIGGPSSSSSGYSLTARSCAVGNLTLSHEMGHNMGSTHNPENGSGGYFPYSYGHYVNGAFRTVMSYTNPCTSGCVRRPYFSSPDVFYNGNATGIHDQRDNVRSLNGTADNVANYRYSGSSIQLTNFTGTNERIARNIRRNITWTSDNITGNVNIQISGDEGKTWQTVIANTPNDGIEPITLYSRPTRKARLRVTSVNTATVTDSSLRNISIQ